MPGKKALCVGLNYPNRGNLGLVGGVNDALNWNRLLHEQFGFDDIRVLVDQHPDGSAISAKTQIPTQLNIIQQLGGWLCRGAVEGDTLVFVFSGLGCQVKDESSGRIEEALVPSDYEDTKTEKLLYQDDLFAVFQLLPPGCIITVIMDCCSGSYMLDVPFSVDSQTRTVSTSVERPYEATSRGPTAWQAVEAWNPGAYPKPKFLPTVRTTKQRQRRIADGLGAFAGQMTLNPGVSAFLFAATRTANELALDASIVKMPRGVLSFCLMKVLEETQYAKCTYQTWFEKAAEKLEDLRARYVRQMDQHFLLRFCPNSKPSDVVVFDPDYAIVAQYTLSQQMPGGVDVGGPPDGAPPRESSTDFVPAPSHAHQNQDQQMPPTQMTAARLYLVVHEVRHLNSVVNGQCDPFVETKVGSEAYRTCTIPGSVDPMWEKENHFTFPVHPSGADDSLHIEVLNAARQESLGRTTVDLRALPPTTWHRQRSRLQDQYGRPAGEAEIQFDVRLEPLQRPQDRQQPPPQQQEVPAQRQRPPPPPLEPQQPLQQQLPLDYPPRRPATPGVGSQQPRPPSPMRPAMEPPPVEPAAPGRGLHAGGLSPTARGTAGFSPDLRGGVGTGFGAGFSAGPGACLGTGLSPCGLSPFGVRGVGQDSAPPARAFPDIFGAPNLLGHMPNLLQPGTMGAAGAALPAPGGGGPAGYGQPSTLVSLGTAFGGGGASAFSGGGAAYGGTAAYGVAGSTAYGSAACGPAVAYGSGSLAAAPAAALGAAYDGGAAAAYGGAAAAAYGVAGLPEGVYSAHSCPYTAPQYEAAASLAPAYEAYDQLSAAGGNAYVQAPGGGLAYAYDPAIDGVAGAAYPAAQVAYGNGICSYAAPQPTSYTTATGAIPASSSTEPSYRVAQAAGSYTMPSGTVYASAAPATAAVSSPMVVAAPQAYPLGVHHTPMGGDGVPESSSGLPLGYSPYPQARRLY